MSSFLATKGECFQERLKPCALLLVTGLSVSESFVCVWGGLWEGVPTKWDGIMKFGQSKP